MAAGGSGGELSRPEPTGYGHSDWQEVDSTGLSGPREDVRHVGEERLEPHEWGEARSDRHGDPGQSRAPAREPRGLFVPPPRWPLRTEGNMGGWKAAFFGTPAVGVEDLDTDASGAVRRGGKLLAVRYQDMLVVAEHPAPEDADAVRELIAGAERSGLEVERLDDQKLEGFARATARREGEEMGAQKTTAKKTTAKAAKDGGVSAGHKKIINEVLAREDAKPTGDAVRMAESNPRREFARYQVPTDRGLKDIEIFGDRVKVRSESTYGFPKVAQDGADGLPDRVAPPDEIQTLVEEEPVPAEPDEELGEAVEETEGLLLHVDIVASSPDGMEEEDMISILDEALLDPEIADAINAKLEGTGVTLRILEVETYDEEDEDESEYVEGEMADVPGPDEEAAAIEGEEVAE